MSELARVVRMLATADVEDPAAVEGVREEMGTILNGHPPRWRSAARMAAVEERREYGDPEPDRSVASLLGEEEDAELPMPVAALDADVPPPPEFQVDGLILEAELGLIVGDGGAWKTTACLEIARAVAGGESVFGSRVFQAQQGRVLYVSAEDGPGVLLNRLEALVRGRGCDRERVLGNIYFLAREGVSLDERKWRQHLAAQVEELGIDLVILDPYAELTVAEENANDAVKPLVRFWRQLNELGATVLVAHHAGKKYEGKRKLDRVRGASALNAAARMVYLLEPAELGLTVEALKLSRAERPARFVVETEVESDPENRAAWTSARLQYISEHAAEDMIAEQFVLENLTGEPGPNGSELKKMAHQAQGLSPTEVSEALSTLHEHGKIDFERGQHNAKNWFRTDWVASPDTRPPETGSRRSRPRPPDEAAGGDGPYRGPTPQPREGGDDTRPSAEHPLDEIAAEEGS